MTKDEAVLIICRAWRELQAGRMTPKEYSDIYDRHVDIACGKERADA